MYVYVGFPGGCDSKESACNAGDSGSIPESGRSPGEGNGNLLQYSCLGNPMDRGAWWTTVHGVTESDRTEQLTHYTTHSLCITDSLFCTPKTNTTLSINYTPIKIFLKSSIEIIR